MSMTGRRCESTAGFSHITDQRGTVLENHSIASQLLIAAATTAPDAGAVGRIRTLAELVDWHDFTRLALRHAVAPLVFRTLARVAGDLLPPDMAEAAAKHCVRHAEQNAQKSDELIRILQALRHAGIDAVPFKGPVLAATVYGEVGLRSFRDLDFLVREGDAVRTLEALQTIGYRSAVNRFTPAQARAERRYSGQDLMIQCDSRIAIEPHWAFGPRTWAVDLDYAGLWRRLRRRKFRGADILMLSPEDTLLLLAIHGSKEQWVRLQWICDVAEALRRFPRLDWHALIARARADGCLRMLLLAIRLADALLGVGPADQIRALLRTDPVVEDLAHEVIAKLLGENLEAPSIYHVTSFRRRLRERWHDRLAYQWRTITTPRSQHYGLVRLPDALFGLYTPIKLAHDYLLLPLWWLVTPLWRRKPSDQDGRRAGSDPVEI